MIGGGHPRRAVASMASSCSCRSASASDACRTASTSFTASASIASASCASSSRKGDRVVAAASVAVACASRSRGPSVRGASAGGGTAGRRTAELRACVGARVRAAARVARSDPSGSADSGSTITEGSRGRLPMMGAGWVIETGGFCTKANGERSGGAGCAPPLPCGRPSRNTGSSPGPCSLSDSLEAGCGDSSASSRDSIGDESASGSAPGSAPGPIASTGRRGTRSASCNGMGIASDAPPRLLAATSEGRSKTGPDRSGVAVPRCRAPSFLRCRMMRPSAFATSPAMAMTSVTSRSTTSTSPLSAYSSTAQRPRRLTGNTKALALNCRCRSVMRVRSMPSLPSRVRRTLQLSAASDSELGRSSGTPMPSTASRSAPLPQASSPSASELCTAKSALYSKNCDAKPKKMSSTSLRVVARPSSSRARARLSGPRRRLEREPLLGGAELPWRGVSLARRCRTLGGRIESRCPVGRSLGGRGRLESCESDQSPSGVSCPTASKSPSSRAMPR
jgi:hypothetical protein